MARFGSNTARAYDAAFAYIARRLRAHARLCHQVAVETRSEQTAGEFATLAEHCSRKANELEPAAPANPPQLH